VSPRYPHHPGTMDIGLVVREMNDACNSVSGKSGWALLVSPTKDGTVKFGVSGSVLPLRPLRSDGERYRRGHVPFYGDQHADVFQALRSGLVDMRKAQESRR